MNLQQTNGQVTLTVYVKKQALTQITPITTIFNTTLIDMRLKKRKWEVKQTIVKVENKKSIGMDIITNKTKKYDGNDLTREPETYNKIM